MSEGHVKVALTKESAEVLAEMVRRVNEGHQGGHIGQRDLASWAIMHFSRASFKDCMEEVRAAYFDRLAYASTVIRELRLAAKAGMSNDEIDARLAELGIGRPAKARTRKAGQASGPTLEHPTLGVAPTTAGTEARFSAKKEISP